MESTRYSNVFGPDHHCKINYMGVFNYDVNINVYRAFSDSMYPKSREVFSPALVGVWKRKSLTHKI